MKRIIALPTLLLLVLTCGAAHAAVITMFDYDTAVYQPGDEYIFAGSISLADPMFSVAFLLDNETSPGASDQEFLFVTISAPIGLNLYGVITSEPDGAGTIWVRAEGTVIPGLILARTSFAMPFDGNLDVDQYKWVTVGIYDVDDQDTIDFFDSLPNGELQLSNIVPAPVPVPAAVWLFGSGLLGLVGMARRKKA